MSLRGAAAHTVAPHVARGDLIIVVIVVPLLVLAWMRVRSR